MNLLIIILAVLALLPADTPPTFDWTPAFPPAGVVTWQGPGELRALRGAEAPIVATATEAGPVTTAVGVVPPGTLYCAIRDGELVGCVSPTPAPALVFLPAVET